MRGPVWTISLMMAIGSAAVGETSGINETEIKIGSCSALDGPARQRVEMRWEAECSASMRARNQWMLVAARESRYNGQQ
jgi:hypothetical protein